MLPEPNSNSPIKWPLIVGSLLSALAVVIGAFGAHALKGSLSTRELGWYETGVMYHAVHALALLITGLLTIHPTAKNALSWLSAASGCFLLGTFLFAGSLYLMAITQITALGIVTPFGGVFMIAGWLCLAVSAYKLTSGVS